MGGGKERSAALPSGLGTAALLGVLAGFLGGTLRNHWWQALFEAGPPQNIEGSFRANLSGSRFLLHTVCLLLDAGLWIQILNTVALNAARLPEAISANSAFSSCFKRHRKDSWRQRGTPCWRGTPLLQPVRGARASSATRNRAWLAAESVSRRRAAAFLASMHVMAVAFQVTVEAGSPDSQDLRSPQAVPLAHLEHSLDVQFAHVVEGERPPRIAFQPWRVAVLQVLRQVREIDEIARCGDRPGGNHVLQFTHISRPGMLQQRRLGPARQPRDILPIYVVIFF